MKNIADFFNNGYTRKDIVSELTKQKEKIEALIQTNKLKDATENELYIRKIHVNPKKVISKTVIADNLEQLYEKYYDFLAYAVKHAEKCDPATTFFEFDSIQPQFTQIKAKMCIETRKSPLIEIVDGFDALATYHRGSYETLGKTYAALIEYSVSHNLTLKGNAYEFYDESINMHTKTTDYLTEIVLPILQ